MQFAINYSHPAADLVRSGRTQVDRFKTPDWPWMVSEALELHPVAVHFTLRAGSGELAQRDWSSVQALLEQTGTPFINLHLEPTIKDFPGVDSLKPSAKQRQKITNALLNDVLALVEHFGAPRVIVENVPYRGAQGKALRTGVEPETLQYIFEQTGCGLLLDISHARIAAHYLGIDAHEYMAALPVHALRELHVTGLHWIDDRLQDHLPMLPTDWPHLEWVLERIRRSEWGQPWLLAFEYGGVGDKFDWRSDPLVIETQVPRLYDLTHSLKT